MVRLSRWALFLKRTARRPARPILAGLLLAAALYAGYSAKTAAACAAGCGRTAALWGFLFRQMTNMSPSAATRRSAAGGARISGYVFPSHYFPHLFVASFDVGAGIDYLDGFWFSRRPSAWRFAAAVLAFAKRWLHSPWLACLAAGDLRVPSLHPQDKTLDLSFALLLLAIGSPIDGCSHRRRWLAWCVVLRSPRAL